MNKLYLLLIALLALPLSLWLSKQDGAGDDPVAGLQTVSTTQDPVPANNQPRSAITMVDGVPTVSVDNADEVPIVLQSVEPGEPQSAKAPHSDNTVSTPLTIATLTGSRLVLVSFLEPAFVQLEDGRRLQKGDELAPDITLDHIGTDDDAVVLLALNEQGNAVSVTID